MDANLAHLIPNIVDVFRQRRRAKSAPQPPVDGPENPTSADQELSLPPSPRLPPPLPPYAPPSEPPPPPSPPLPPYSPHSSPTLLALPPSPPRPTQDPPPYTRSPPSGHRHLDGTFSCTLTIRYHARDLLCQTPTARKITYRVSISEAISYLNLQNVVRQLVRKLDLRREGAEEVKVTPRWTFARLWARAGWEDVVVGEENWGDVVGGLRGGWYEGLEVVCA